MDEYAGGARGGWPGNRRRDAEHGRSPEEGLPGDGASPQDDSPARDDAYSWGGKPGEDFGPIAPPPPSSRAPRAPRQPSADRPLTDDEGADQPTTERRPVGPDPESPSDATARLPESRQRAPQAARDRAPQAAPTAWPPLPSGQARSRPIRPRSSLKAPLLTLVAVLVVLAGMVGGVLFMLSRQGSSSGLTGDPATPPALAVASPEASPAARTPATAAASPAPQTAASPAAAPPAVGGATPPAPTAFGTPAASAASPAPASATPARATPTRATSPTPRSSPVIVPTIPSLIAPPGLRFPTNTPARIVATRTPPPVPTPRPASANTPLRVDRNTYKTGEDATVCAQATFGSTAQIGVLEPNGAQRTLGEFQPPAERVCHTLKLENPGIYVLTLTVKDGSGRELERHATVIAASR